MAAKSRAKWEHYCAEKDFTGRIWTWRRQREHGTLQALTPRKRGRKAKPVNPLDHQLRQVEAENRKLASSRSLKPCDLQKKVSQLWESLWRAAKSDC